MDSRLLFLHHPTGGYEGTQLIGWSLRLEAGSASVEESRLVGMISALRLSRKALYLVKVG